jgi:hypothetical protein
MKYRERLAARVKSLLMPGDELRHIFEAYSVHPVPGFFLRRFYRVVVVTDTQFLVTSPKYVQGPKFMRNPAKVGPKGVDWAEPRRVLAPAGVIAAKVYLGNSTWYVTRRWFRDLDAQDAELISRWHNPG